MKKFSLMAGAGLIATAAFATPAWVDFSTGPEKDTYADGKEVMDGEIYALVFVKGEAFEGINPDGTTVDPEDKIVCRAAVAKDGVCPKITYIIDPKVSTGDGEVVEEYTGGRFEVYLFDTRVNTYDEKGILTGTTVGLKEGGTVYSGWGKVAAEIKTSSTVAAAGATAVSTATEVVDAAAVKPVVTAFDLDEKAGLAYIKVANTKPFLKYAILAKKSIGGTEEKLFCSGVQGVANGELTLVYRDDPEDRYYFFRVVRSK